MYIKDGIAYAGEEKAPITVSGVRPLADYILWVRFNTGEAKKVDFKKLLSTPAFEPLKDASVWGGVYIDYGCTVWQDGNIDIAPEYLYENAREEPGRYETPADPRPGIGFPQPDGIPLGCSTGKNLL